MQEPSDVLRFVYVCVNETTTTTSTGTQKFDCFKSTF